MDASVKTARAKFLTTPKSSGVPGVLTFTQSRFLWQSNDPKAASKIDVSFTAIKGHRSNKETEKFRRALLNLFTDADMKEGYLFEFENFQDRDDCRDLVAKILGKQQRSASVEPATQGSGQAKHVGTTQAGHLNKAEMERRMKLLSEDRELQKLHQQLVISGVISESEFWAARKNMLEDESSKVVKQRTGLKSSMLADIKPTADGRTNKVTFSLTPETIHQIFSEKPAVHQAFLLNVPSKMTEVDFWTRYFKVEFSLRVKSAAAVAVEAEEDEDHMMFLKGDDIIMNETRRKMRKVDPTVDMAADMADDYLSLPGRGIFRDGMKECVPAAQSNQIKKSLVHDVNRHAAVVLEGQPLDEELQDTIAVAHALAKARLVEAETDNDIGEMQHRRLERVREMTEIDDLCGPQHQPYAPLCIQDARKYFDSQQPNVATSTDVSATCMTPLDPEKCLHSFRKQVHEFKKIGFSCPPIMPDTALKVLNEITNCISRAQFQHGKDAEKNVLDSLPRNTKDDILQFAATANELLRHFWATYPLTSVPLIEKASRLKDAMSQLDNKIKAVKDSVLPEFRHKVSQLVHPLSQSLEAAFEHYENDKKRRAAKNIQKTTAKNGSFETANGMFSVGQVAS